MYRDRPLRENAHFGPCVRIMQLALFTHSAAACTAISLRHRDGAPLPP